MKFLREYFSSKDGFLNVPGSEGVEGLTLLLAASKRQFQSPSCDWNFPQIFLSILLPILTWRVLWWTDMLGSWCILGQPGDKKCPEVIDLQITYLKENSRPLLSRNQRDLNFNGKAFKMSIFDSGFLHTNKVRGEKMRTVRQLITPHVDIVIHIGEVLQNPEIISNCLMYSICM